MSKALITTASSEVQALNLRIDDVTEQITAVVRNSVLTQLLQDNTLQTDKTQSTTLEVGEITIEDNIISTSTAEMIIRAPTIKIEGNLEVTKDLTTNRSMMNLLVNTMSVEDPLILLNTVPNDYIGANIGLAFQYIIPGTSIQQMGFMGYASSRRKFFLMDNAALNAETNLFTSPPTNFANLQLNNIDGTGYATFNGNFFNHGNATLGAGVVYANATNRRVGINTQNPRAEFDVSGALVVDKQAQFYNNVNISGSLALGGNVNLNSDLTIEGDLIVKNIISQTKELSLGTGIVIIEGAGQTDPQIVENELSLLKDKVSELEGKVASLISIIENHLGVSVP